MKRRQSDPIIVQALLAGAERQHEETPCTWEKPCIFCRAIAAHNPEAAAGLQRFMAFLKKWRITGKQTGGIFADLVFALALLAALLGAITTGCYYFRGASGDPLSDYIGHQIDLRR
jgi:hypothetical protein